MKTITAIYLLTVIIGVTACKKDKTGGITSGTYSIPNADFEDWGPYNSLLDWKTNSCPLCVPAINTYTVQQVTDAWHGQFAAKFIYNGAYAATAENKFAVQGHPVSLTAYTKSTLYGADTVSIKITLFKNSAAVDGGEWLGTSSTANYTKITIPITQNSMQADSALISIKGGHKTNFVDKSTALWVDDLTLQ